MAVVVVVRRAAAVITLVNMLLVLELVVGGFVFSSCVFPGTPEKLQAGECEEAVLLAQN